jgi:predicted transcriptional regulator
MFESLTIIIIFIGVTFVFLSFYIDEKHNNNVSKTIEDYEEYQLRINEVSNKFAELNEYSEFIKKELEEKHKELLFLYHLTNEKAKMLDSGDEEQSFLENTSRDTIDVNGVYFEEINSIKETNIKILELANQGYKIRDIAKLLDIGQGEVRLVLNLFK